MIITDIITITELSRLTNKSRPTLYKYIRDYENEKFDEIPYSFIKLFSMVNGSTKEDIIKYCRMMYGENKSYDRDVQEVISLINDNADKLDIIKIKNIIKGELKNDN